MVFTIANKYRTISINKNTMGPCKSAFERVTIRAIRFFTIAHQQL